MIKLLLTAWTIIAVVVIKKIKKGLHNTHFGSDTRQPCTTSKPKLCPAIAAAAIVLTLLGARGQRPRTGPS